jgi:protein ImuB
MIRQVAQFLSGLDARVSLADTIGAAWGVGRWGRAGVVPRGGSEAALLPLPVAALRLSPAIVETLNELDIRTIGQLQALPRASLTSRFGASVAKRLDQALGQLPEMIVPVRGTEPICAGWDFDEPAADRRSLELCLHQLIEQVAAALQERQLGVQQLTCRVDGISFIVGTTGSTASVPHLWELVRLHLERVALPREVRRVEIRATLTSRRVEQQQQIISEERADPRELRLLLDRLGSRLGSGALLRPALVPDPFPEFACRFDSVFDAATEERPPNPTGLFRPVRMFPRPIPVEVVSVVPDGPPLRFRWQNEDHTVDHPWGPERIVGGWWRGKQVCRDYYRVETIAGRRFWLFRTEGAWFLHGVFE